MIPLTITLQGLVRPKKNSKRVVMGIGRKPVILSSVGFLAWHKSAMTQLAIGAYPRNKISTPIMVKIQFMIKDSRRRDLTNMAESVMDLLVDYGVIADDRWQICRFVSMVGFVDTEDSVKIVIESLEISPC
jgi:Holliday junction resolvase RusA-like endonuclease